MKTSKIIATILLVSSALSSSISFAESIDERNLSFAVQVFGTAPDISKGNLEGNSFEHIQYGWTDNISYINGAAAKVDYAIMQKFRAGVELSYIGLGDPIGAVETKQENENKRSLKLSGPTAMFVATVDVVDLGPVSCNFFAGAGASYMSGTTNMVVIDQQVDTSKATYKTAETKYSNDFGFAYKFGIGFGLAIADDALLTLSGDYTAVTGAGKSSKEGATDADTWSKEVMSGRYGSYNVGLGIRFAI